jgi:hypothetical protein
MKQITIASFHDFHDIVVDCPPMSIFRGVRKKNYLLIPKVGRLQNYSRELEKGMLARFKVHAAPYVERDLNDWQWLVVAQHHGLSTRLLDWSTNALVALFFAVEKAFEGDSAVYAFKTNKGAINDTFRLSPFEVDGIYRFHPRNITPRLAAQSASFTVQDWPQMDIGGKAITKIVIPLNLRQQLKNVLYRYGVHRGSLFPDLDGQAQMIEWLYENYTADPEKPEPYTLKPQKHLQTDTGDQDNQRNSEENPGIPDGNSEDKKL